jgi:hypothetical protein
MMIWTSREMIYNFWKPIVHFNSSRMKDLMTHLTKLEICPYITPFRKSSRYWFDHIILFYLVFMICVGKTKKSLKLKKNSTIYCFFLK